VFIKKKNTFGDLYSAYPALPGDFFDLPKFDVYQQQQQQRL
jgi:hypothetical protein